MAYNVYIRGLSRAGFRVPKVGGGWAHVVCNASASPVQVDLDNHVTQWILNSERDNFVRVFASNATTVYITGLTRHGFRVLTTGGTYKQIKLGTTPTQVTLTDYRVCRALRRNYGQYVAGASTLSTTAFQVYGTVNKQKGFDVGLGSQATAVLSSDGTNPAVADTVVVNNVTYRFESTLAQANDVKIGASSDATLTSLAKAINQNGTIGTDYFTGTVAPTGVTSSVEQGSGATGKLIFTATAAGPAGNSFASTVVSAHLSFGATTFTGGGGGVGISESQTPTKVYRGQLVTLDMTQDFNFTQLRRHYKSWLEA